MKIYIDADEWYPVYSLSRVKNHDFEVESDAPEELVERWEKTMEKFRELQAEIKKLTVE